MTVARKDYKCDLCDQPISKGSEYQREEVTPWHRAPDSDPGYATYHLHHECNAIWTTMREPDEYEFPPLDEWHRMVAEYQQRKAVERTPEEVARVPEQQIDQFAMVLDFHRKFGAYIGDKPTVPPKEVVDLRLRLIREELGELIGALTGFDCEVAVRATNNQWRPPNIEDAADALADLAYVVLGTAVSCGIDLRPIFAEVHRTNMLKEGGATRPDGKVMKPPGWQPPSLAPLLEGMSLTAETADEVKSLHHRLTDADRRLVEARKNALVVRVRLDYPKSLLHGLIGSLRRFDGERWYVEFMPGASGYYFATSLTVVTEDER